MSDDRQFMRRAEAADYLKNKYGVVTKATLATLAVRGDGPVFQRFGRFPVYRAEDLDAWARDRMSRKVTKTCELTA